LLLVFPTSFYLGAVYTESFFLFLALLFFLLLKQRRFGWAALIAGLAAGTRLVGSLLALSLLIELYPYLKSRRSLALLLPLSISGLLAYMYFLWQKFGDPLAFIHVQSMFGAGRSSGEVVLLPQVIYRYLSIFLTVSPLTLLFQRALLEFVVFVTFLGVLISRWKQLPLSWSVYILGSLLLPTLSGTLSSLPRYVLVLLPFLLVSPKSNLKYFVLVLASAVFLLILLSLFVSGQFVS
jgi:Gpi18-like mannosyltransferase